MPNRIWLVALVAVASGCDRPAGGVPATCGVTHLAAATKLLEQFTVPQQTLAAPPQTLSERLVARVVADGAFPAVVGRTDSLLVIGVEGTPPPTVRPGFGVLVVAPEGRALGVVIYEGDPITGAPRLGEVSIAGARLPLIGVTGDPAKFDDPQCPAMFPDTVIR